MGSNGAVGVWLGDGACFARRRGDFQRGGGDGRRYHARLGAHARDGDDRHEHCADLRRFFGAWAVAVRPHRHERDFSADCCVGAGRDWPDLEHSVSEAKCCADHQWSSDAAGVERFASVAAQSRRVCAARGADGDVGGDSASIVGAECVASAKHMAVSGGDFDQHGADDSADYPRRKIWQDV